MSKKISVWMLLAGVLIAALYGSFLHNPIVFDDLQFFMVDNAGHSAIEEFAHHSVLELRALPYATLAWNAQVFGFDLPSFRIENLVLHWLVVIVLALFVLRLYSMILPAEQSGENTRMTTAVLLVVTLFALHPVSVYAVAYLVQRSILIASLFSLLALWTYLQGISGKGRVWLWLSVLMYFMATHSKEHVIMLPAVIVLMTVLLHQDWRARLRENWQICIAYVAVGLLTIAQSSGVIGHAYEPNAIDMFQTGVPEHAVFYSVLTQCWLFFKYGLLWLLPNTRWLSVDMREPFAQGIFSLYSVALLAYLFYGLVAGRLLLKRGRPGLIGFAMLFPWLMFATEFSTVRLQEIFVLYRSYIWAVGGVILLPLLLMRLNARLTMLLALLFAATLFMMSIERLASFSETVILWDDAEKLVKDRQSLPGAGRIYYNRGTAFLNLGMIDRAIPDLQLAAQLNPGLSAIPGNLGVAYSKLGQHEQAIQAFSRAIKIDQERQAAPNYNFYSGRAGAYEANGDWLKAAVDYKVTCLLANKGCDKNTLAAPLLLK